MCTLTHYLFYESPKVDIVLVFLSAKLANKHKKIGL